MTRLLLTLASLMLLVGCGQHVVQVDQSVGSSSGTTMRGCSHHEYEYVDEYDEDGNCIIEKADFKVCDPHDCYYTESVRREGDCLTFTDVFDRNEKTICGFYSLMPTP